MGRAGACAVALKHNSLTEAAKLAEYFRASIAAAQGKPLPAPEPAPLAPPVPALARA
jgi:hypothetical protein